MGTQLPPKGGKPPSPQFLAHVYCGQTVAHLSYCRALVKTCKQTDRKTHKQTYRHADMAILLNPPGDIVTMNKNNWKLKTSWHK